MANLIANAATTQLMSGAATFAACDVGAGSFQAIPYTGTVASILAAGSGSSATFTVANGAVIDGVILWITSTLNAVTGTYLIELQKGGVTQASVTVNKSDIPTVALTAPPVFFKFTSTATGDGAATWTLKHTTTGTGTMTMALHVAGTTNWRRALRTTTAATAAAGDNLFILGELTGAGTHTSRTVTMDSTTSTAYGNGSVNSQTVYGGLIGVACYGTLAYGTTASTNYLLRIAGDLKVYENGTLKIGSSGAEIPRNSTAVLEFQPVSADGDFGLIGYDNSTVNIAGLSRTSGKNIVKCKLTADVVSSSVIVNATTVNGGSQAATSLEASGNSLLAIGFTENGVNTFHGPNLSGTAGNPSVTNTTQTATIWLARGSGTNNRYIRLIMANSNNPSTYTNGFYADIDLQAGTVGTVTAVGNGTATSVSITALGTGYLIRMTGKVSTAATTTYLHAMACAVAGTISYLGTSTQCFIYDHAAVVTAASISDTTFNVDTDTGWLSGDAIIVASTTQTSTECEIYPLNANAGASSMVSGLYPFSINAGSTHHGTAPVQAEIGLLTRNVKIRSTSTTLMSGYVYLTALATATFSWAEFYYNASGVATKRGIEIEGGTTATAKSITYCSIHDADVGGVYLSGAASLNVTFSNNVLWKSLSGGFVSLDAAVSAADWTMSNNLVMRSFTSCYSLVDVQGTFTNNIGVGSLGYGLSSAGTSGAVMGGTWQDNEFHSNVVGLTVAGTHSGTYQGTKIWRNSTYGIVNSAGSTPDVYHEGCLIFGNASGAYQNNGGDVVNISNSVLCGDTTYPSLYGIYTNSTAIQEINLDTVDFTGDTHTYASILVPNSTADFYFAQAATSRPKILGLANNCLFGAPTLMTGTVSAKANWSNLSQLSFQKFNQTAGDHRTEYTYGQIKSDTAVFDLASPSVRMTPSDATNKLQVDLLQVAVNSGDTVTPTFPVRKDATYNGNQPRLGVRRNDAIGITADTIIATYASGTGSWNNLSGATAAVTSDGVMEFYLDVDGTAGYVNVDDWSYV